MTTPREILLARHRSAAPKLDAIRREVLSAEFIREGRRVAVPKFRVADTATLPLLVWRELIFPCRRTWTALAAVWVALFIFNVSQRDKSELATRKLPPPSPEAIMAWRQQEKLLAELIGPSAPGDVERRKIFLPQPRSEGCLGNFLMT
jgi:hypothetical protein